MCLRPFPVFALFVACSTQSPGVDPPHAREGLAAAPHPVAPLSDAITLARASVAGAVHTLAVVADRGDAIDAVDLSAALGEFPDSPMELVRVHGVDALAQTVARAPPIARATRDLLVPIAGATAHVASAENYPDHQQETGLVASPFLFPKIVAPTGASVDVARQAKDLLDYEVELCATFGDDVASTADLAKVPVGLMVCNDLSERAVQVHSFDPNNPKTAKGFTDGKSRPGFLPTGPYVVVPRDWRSFVPKIDLRLSWNGQARQNDEAAHMIWDIERQVEEALALGKDARFTHGGKPVALLPEGKIAKGSILVSGTPGGVILKAPPQAFVVEKLADYVTKAGFVKTLDPEQYVKDAYVDELRKNGHFLMPGDVIDCEADWLGAIHITISGSKD